MIDRKGFLALSGLAGVAAATRTNLSPAAEAQSEDRPADPVKITDVRIIRLTGRGERPYRAIYAEIETEAGLVGRAGPLMPEQAFILRNKLRSVLIGRDALAGEALWEAMRRRDRHARAAQMMMAISAADIALWDIRGKHFGVPVYRLLGGPTSDRLPVYASMLGYPTEPAKAHKVAREFYDRGFTAQKWFFPYNPADGSEGRRKNIALAEALRDMLGSDVRLMFDGKWAWDVPYSIDMARAILPMQPYWLEEPLHPEQIEGYQRLKEDTRIPLASGEHFYTRWNVKRFLDRGILDFVQTDPEWCGGITELLKICALADAYEVKVVPHGHHVLAAAHVVASQHRTLCPMVEYLIHGHLDRMQHFQKTILRPENGTMELPSEPGLGITFDEEKIAEREVLEWG